LSNPVTPIYPIRLGRYANIANPHARSRVHRQHDSLRPRCSDGQPNRPHRRRDM